jgi:hypothetical protein
MKQQLNEVQQLQKIAGITKEEVSTGEQSVDASKFLDKDEVPGSDNLEEAGIDVKAILAKDVEVRTKAKQRWDALKGKKFIHKDDPKKMVFTINSVNYPKGENNLPASANYGNSWNYFVTLNWKGKKANALDYFKLNHVFANFKDGTWIPVK